MGVVNNCYENRTEPKNHFVYVECPNVCGTVTSSINPNAGHQMRIAGGQKAAPESHPWQAVLYLNGMFKCGGSIVKRRWVRINSSFFKVFVIISVYVWVL